MPLYRIGCAGWSYRDWVGAVYPSHLPPGRWLGAYAQLFSFCEIDSTFYGLPSPTTVAGWLDRVRPVRDFSFAAKLSQEVTHRALPSGQMDAARRATDDFLHAVVRPLEEHQRLEAILVQLPPSFTRDDAPGGRDALEVLLEVVGRLEPRRRRVAVEFRHASWFEHVGERLLAEATESLSAAGVGLVRVDGLGFRFANTRTTDWTYFRLHGRRSYIPPSERGLSHAPYNYLYPKEEVQEIAAAVRATAEEDQRTIVVLNNHYKGQAARNAMDLIEALGLPRPKPTALAARASRLEEFGADAD